MASCGSFKQACIAWFSEERDKSTHTIKTLLPRVKINLQNNRINIPGDTERGKIDYLLQPERTLQETKELVLHNGKAKQPCKLLYWECVGLLRSMEFGDNGPGSVRWYYGFRYAQSFRIYIQALINSPKKLSNARDDDMSCEAEFSLPRRANVRKIADCHELMRKLCKQVYKKSDRFKRFLWHGTQELTQ